MARSALFLSFFAAILLLLPQCTDKKPPSVQPVEEPELSGNFPPRGTKINWRIPLVTQATPYTCGASCLQGVLAYYGQVYTEEFLAKALGSTPKEGTDHLQMVAFAKKVGLKAEVRSQLQLPDLVAALENNQVVIVECQAHEESKPINDKANTDYTNVWDSGHYMIVIGIDDKNIYFVDPSARGSRSFISLEEFLPRWHDVDWKNNQLQHTAIFFEGKPSPTKLPTSWEKVP